MDIKHPRYPSPTELSAGATTLAIVIFGAIVVASASEFVGGYFGGMLLILVVLGMMLTAHKSHLI